MKKTVHSRVYKVYSGSGHNGPRIFVDVMEARKYAEEKAAVPSYIGSGRTHAQLVTEVSMITVEDIW